jgi:hypothetical protein
VGAYGAVDHPEDIAVKLGELSSKARENGTACAQRTAQNGVDAADRDRPRQRAQNIFSLLILAVSGAKVFKDPLGRFCVALRDM